MRTSGLEGKGAKKNVTSIHATYSKPNSTNRLGSLVINSGSHIPAIEDHPEATPLWQPLRSFALMSIFTICGQVNRSTTEERKELDDALRVLFTLMQRAA